MAILTYIIPLNTCSLLHHSQMTAYNECYSTFQGLGLQLSYYCSARKDMYGTTTPSNIATNSLPNKACIHSYKTRLFRNKAALMILQWVFTASLNVIIAIQFIDNYNTKYLAGATALSATALSATALSALALSAPIALVADIYLGRYKVIQYSMRLLWIAVIASNTIIALQYYAVKNAATSTILIVFTTIGVAGSAGIIVNSLQFGIDQLTDASSSDITSYISWYIWNFMLASTTGVIFTNCLTRYISLSYFVLPLSCTLSILSDCCFSHWLVKEPVTINPLKLIYQVLKYAVKNKYPRLRSAFTYWEDKPYSRIDLGKNKYGGPFTIEQVEDVKTFFRILAVFGFCTPMVILVCSLDYLFYIQYFDNQFLLSLKNNSVAKYIKSCYYEYFSLIFDIITIVFLVPVIEFTLYPLLMKCTRCINFSIRGRFLLGIFVIILYELHLLGIELVVTQTSDLHNSTCFYYVNEETVSLYWLILPKVLYGIALYIIYTSSLEFIASQAPYSMRGLLFGIDILLIGLSAAALSTLCYLLGKLSRKYYTQSNGANCELWLYGCILFLTIVLLCAGFIVTKRYTLRRRDEDLPNEQKFAVDYYEKYLSQVS